MKKKNHVISACSVLLMVSLVLALPSYSAAQNRNEVRENIRTLMMLRMTQVLDLSEEQAAKIFPKMNRIEKEKAALHREIGRQMIELKLILDRENPAEEKIIGKIGEIKRLRQDLRAKDQEFESFLDANLTLVQRARYIVFSQEFFKNLREKLDKARIYQERLKKDRRFSP